MKLLSLILSLLLLTGCGATMAKLEAVDEKLDAVEETVENKVEAAEAKVETTINPISEQSAAETLTQAQAEAIALEHAGFTADQVTGLRVNYEIDDGIPEYEVEFRVERMEYDYTIHAETGEILSYDMDD